jgi:hypothetical protein
MKMQFCSGLDLEFPTNKQYLKANPIKAKGEILLFAGDNTLFVKIKKGQPFL